jgi:hypothetical protein
MRILKVRNKTSKTKLGIATVALASLTLVIAGSILFNPICIGAGVAGLFLSCGAAVSLKPRAPTHLV